MDIICADEIDAQARDKVFDISEPVSLWWAAAAFEDKYLCLDCVEICKTHSKEELISYFNRFVKAMAEIKKYNAACTYYRKKELCVISSEELDEFLKLASQAEKCQKRN